jgi:hypothetical protein
MSDGIVGLPAGAQVKPIQGLPAGAQVKPIQATAPAAAAPPAGNVPPPPGTPDGPAMPVPAGLQGAQTEAEQVTPDADRGAAQGVKRGAKTLVHLPVDLVKTAFMPPQNPEEQAIVDGHGGQGQMALALKRALLDPAVRQWALADSYDARAKNEDEYTANNAVTGTKHLANAHRIGAAVPLVGPMAADAVDRAVGQNDPHGALSEVETQLAGGELAAQLPKGVSKVGGKIAKTVEHNVAGDVAKGAVKTAESGVATATEKTAALEQQQAAARAQQSKAEFNQAQKVAAAKQKSPSTVADIAVDSTRRHLEEINKTRKPAQAPAETTAQPKTTVNGSGESAASQEAVSRVASEKTNGIKRVKITKGGQEVPLVGVDAVDARAGKGETIVKRYADGREEIQDQGAGANYRGPKPGAAPTAAAPKLDPVDIGKETANVRTFRDGAAAIEKAAAPAYEAIDHATNGEFSRIRQVIKDNKEALYRDPNAAAASGNKQFSARQELDLYNKEMDKLFERNSDKISKTDLDVANRSWHTAKVMDDIHSAVDNAMSAPARAEQAGVTRTLDGGKLNKNLRTLLDDRRSQVEVEQAIGKPGLDNLHRLADATSTPKKAANFEEVMRNVAMEMQKAELAASKGKLASAKAEASKYAPTETGHAAWMKFIVHKGIVTGAGSVVGHMVGGPTGATAGATTALAMDVAMQRALHSPRVGKMMADAAATGANAKVYAPLIYRAIIAGEGATQEQEKPKPSAARAKAGNTAMKTAESALSGK